MILGFHWFKGYVALLFVVWIVVGCVFLVWIVLLVFLKSQFIFTHLFGHLITGSVGSWVNLWELSFFFSCYVLMSHLPLSYSSYTTQWQFQFALFLKFVLMHLFFSLSPSPPHSTTIIISLDYYKASWMISLFPAFASLQPILYTAAIPTSK